MTTLGARTRLTGALASLALGALAPAAAQAASPAWHDAGPEGVAGVTFRAVAAQQPAGVVVAVGQEVGKAVIYRRVGGAWVKDALPATVPADSCLTDIAVTDTEAWAIGNSGNADCSTAGTPYAVRVGGWTALAGAAPTWAPVDTSALTARLTAVTLSGSSGGFLGDASGAVRRISAAGVGATLAYSPEAAKLTAVGGLAVSGAGAVLATGTGAAPGVNIFESSADALAPEPFQPDASGTAPVDVGAHPTHPAASLAIESAGAYWRPDSNGAWSRHALTNATELRDATVADGGGAAVAAIAGRSGSAGAVWTRSGTGGWTHHANVATTALNGVAVVAGDDVWAVGGGGTVKRYFAKPVQDTGSGDTGSGDTGSGNTAPAPSGTTTRSAPTGGAPQTTVIQRPARQSPQSRKRPGAKPKPKPKRKAARVMRNVRVRVLRGRLVISFRLAQRARVAARALRGGRLVGRVRPRMLRRGRGRLVLRFPGRRAPTQLQLIVRPAPRAGRAGGR